MVRCPSCGTKCRRAATRCPRCGSPLDPRVAAFGGAARSVREAWGLAPQVETAPVPGRRRVWRWIAVAGCGCAAAAVAAALLVFGGAPSGQEGYSLTDGPFADSAFAAALTGYDRDGDGALSQDEADAVLILDCSDSRVESLAGIEVLRNLVTLDASGNSLDVVDLTGLGSLESLDLSGNRIATLDASPCAKLVILDVSGNSMTSLDVSTCSDLFSLSCAGNEIARLDLSGCTSLVNLDCDDGQNATVPVTAGFFADQHLRTALLAYDADGDGALSLHERERVTSLTLDDPETASLSGLAWFTSLTELDASGTAVTEISKGDLPSSLKTLSASGCRISSVDLTGLDHLVNLDLSGNPISEISLAGLARLTSVDLSDCALEGTLDVTENTRLTRLDVTGNASLELVDARGIASLQTQDATLHDDTCDVRYSDVEEIAAEGDRTAGNESTAEGAVAASEGVPAAEGGTAAEPVSPAGAPVA